MSGSPFSLDPRVQPTRELFERYSRLIAQAIETTEDPWDTDPRLSLTNLAWLCLQGADQVESLPIDKLSRWLGFVQGCLAMRGLIEVDRERELTRPLFHAAYDELGLARPEPAGRNTVPEEDTGADLSP